MNILLLLYLPLFVCISPCLSLFPLSAALHLLYSANVFCLLSPLLHCHSHFPSPLQPLPRSEGESDCEEGSRSCENNWKPNFRQVLMDLFPKLTRAVRMVLEYTHTLRFSLQMLYVRLANIKGLKGYFGMFS